MAWGRVTENRIYKILGDVLSKYYFPLLSKNILKK
jgi:hypothetical protein